MAQVARTTTAPNNVGSWTAANIATLRAKILSGATITAADVQTLSNIISSFYAHKHDVYDHFYEAYGNTPGTGTAGIWGVTSAVSSATNSLPTISGSIKAAEINKMINSVAAIKTHHHWKEDTWY